MICNYFRGGDADGKTGQSVVPAGQCRYSLFRPAKGGVFRHLPLLRPDDDVANPCQPVRFREDNGWLVRFYYYRNRISLEVFHALSDGAGALIFFRTLLAEYLRQTGISVPAGNGVLDLEEPPRKEELEDAYARYAGRHALGLRRMPKAYANTGTPEPF